MTPNEAVEKAAELNRTGKHREHWSYYPTYHYTIHEWFVARRLKKARIRIAVFLNGDCSKLE